MKGWVGLVGWPIADGLPTLVVTHQLQVERRTGKVRRPETDVLPLCHATNRMCIQTFKRKRQRKLMIMHVTQADQTISWLKMLIKCRHGILSWSDTHKVKSQTVARPAWTESFNQWCRTSATATEREQWLREQPDWPSLLHFKPRPTGRPVWLNLIGKIGRPRLILA